VSGCPQPHAECKEENDPWQENQHQDSLLLKLSSHVSCDSSTSQQDNLSHVTSYENSRIQHHAGSVVEACPVSRDWFGRGCGRASPVHGSGRGWSLLRFLSEAHVPRKGAPVKGRTEAFDRLACEPGGPCRAHEDPAVTPPVHQATRAHIAARLQEREDSEKERRPAGSSASVPRPAVEELLSAPLWPRHMFGKMPQTCRAAYRNLMIEPISEFVNVDIDQLTRSRNRCMPTSTCTCLLMPSHVVYTRERMAQEIWPPMQRICAIGLPR
jgi:hypothetical protein